MTLQEARTLITEARTLHYRLTPGDKILVGRLESMKPGVLTKLDAASVTRLYERAAGGALRLVFYRKEKYGGFDDDEDE